MNLNNNIIIINMASDKRSLSDFLNKDEFNFTITSDSIQFGPIFNKQGDRIRTWQSNIYLLDNKNKLNMKEEYIDINNLKKFTNLESEIISTYGLINGKITITEPTIIKKGKNINKINETSVLTQALIQCRSLYLKKINSGYNLNIDINNNQESKKIFPFPMAVNSYKNYKNKLKYPLYVQPKLDGIRLISKLEHDKIILKSRRLKDVADFEFIKNELKVLLQNYPAFIIDGELYTHGVDLQDISGIVRNVKDNNNKIKIQYNIFDCFNTHQPDLTFTERHKILNKMFDNHNFEYLVNLETIQINNEKEGDILYKKYINDKYEGLIYKTSDAKYEFSFDKEKRSMKYLKRKDHQDAEFKIIGFKEGVGKNKGCIDFILETSKHLQFTSSPMWTLEQKKHAFKQATKDFDKYFKYKLATIRYDALSKDGVPLRARLVVIRDYE